MVDGQVRTARFVIDAAAPASRDGESEH
jgi:hypothetical protein